MILNTFSNLLEKRIKLNAFRYLTDKQPSKGSEKKYSDIEMAEYLQPQNNELNI